MNHETNSDTTVVGSVKPGSRHLRKRKVDCNSTYESSSDHSNKRNTTSASAVTESYHDVKRNDFIRMLCTGMRIYNSIYNTTWIPKSFVVPKDDEAWPSELHGLLIGSKLNKLRGRKDKYSEKHIDELNSAGMIWQFQNSYEKMARALEFHIKTTGSAWVSQNYVVPSSEEWPAEFAGMKLGKLLDNARAANNKKKLSVQNFTFLNDVGMIWKHPDRCPYHRFDGDKRTHLLVSGLRIFKQLYGTVQVPQKWVIPPRGNQWPVELHGVRLGQWVQYTRRCWKKLPPDAFDALKALGMLFYDNEADVVV